MTASTDQFVDIATRSQEAITTAVRTWADNLQAVAGTKLPDAWAVVDNYFDLAQQLLDNQRKFALGVLAAGVQATENGTEQVTRVTDAVTAHTLNATETLADEAAEADRDAEAAASKS